MSIIKKTILYNNSDNQIKFSLDIKNNFFDYQQEIDSLTQVVTNNSLNPVVDEETRKFKYNSAYTTDKLNFYFYKNGSYGLNFTNAGFTSDEITKNSLNFINSFFILDFYDTYDINTQSRIFTTYLSKLGTIPSYFIGSATTGQFYGMQVPLSFIETQTTNIVSGYTKFSFFSALKTSNGVKLFYNQNSNKTTAEKMYIKTELDLVNKKWRLDNVSHNINLREYINTTYTNKVNDTFDKFENIKQSYPVGNTFVYSGVSYTTL
jgi:hypothetical protein